MIRDLLTNDATRYSLGSITLAGIFVYLWWQILAAGRQRRQEEAFAALRGPIMLKHGEELFPCADVWDAIAVSHTLSQIDALPEIEDVA